MKKKIKIRNLDRAKTMPEKPFFEEGLEEEENFFGEYMQLKGIKDLEGKQARTGKLTDLKEMQELKPKEKFAGRPQVDLIAERNKKKHDRVIDRDFRPQDTLDLHGEFQEKAIRKTQNFVLSSYQGRLESILIITGKGIHQGKAVGVLRDVVWNWLARNGGSMVESFDWAPPFLGGKGAILIYLN